MGVLRDLLLAQIKSEFVQLQKDFPELELPKETGKKENKPRWWKKNKKSKAPKIDKAYSIETINELFAKYGYDIKFETKKDLFLFLKKALAKDDASDSTASPEAKKEKAAIKKFVKKNGMLLIPLFNHILHDNLEAGDMNGFFDMCMRVHSVKDKKVLFKDGNLLKPNLYFSFDTLATLENIIYSPNYTVDLNSVARVLHFIEYELVRSKDKEATTYIRGLEGCRDGLIPFFCFAASDELFDEFRKNRPGAKEKSKSFDVYKIDSPYSACSEELMKFFIGDSECSSSNKYYQFMAWESKMKKASDLNDKKNSLMVAFTYRPFTTFHRKFYDGFKDVSLTVDDLIGFVKKYEEAGHCLSSRQLDNLLITFGKRYLVLKGWTEEYSDLRKKVIDAFSKYRESRYAFKPEEFIEYFNKSNPNLNFRSFSFNGTNSALTRDIYEIIINGNCLVGFGALKDTNSAKKLIGDKKIEFPTAARDDEKYKQMQEVYSKYFKHLESEIIKQENSKGSFIIRHGVSEAELPIFETLVTWFQKYRLGGKSVFLKRMTDSEVEDLGRKFRDELAKEKFKNRHDSLSKYRTLARNSPAKFLKNYFQDILASYERDFVKEHGEKISSELIKAHEQRQKLTPILAKYNLSPEDIRVVLCQSFPSVLEKEKRKKGWGSSKATPEARAIKLTADTLIATANRQAVQLSNPTSNLISRKVVSNFVNCDASFDEFCDANGIHPIDYINSLVGCKDIEDALYKKMCSVKINGDFANFVEIYKSMRQGVSNADGSKRPFGILDYYAITNVPVADFCNSLLSFVNGSDASDEAKRSISNELNGFSAKYGKKTNQFYINDVLKEPCLFVGGKDSDSIYVVPKEDKVDALAWMMQHNLPNEIGIYNNVLVGIVSGKINVDGNAVRKQVLPENAVLVKRKPVSPSSPSSQP